MSPSKQKPRKPIWSAKANVKLASCYSWMKALWLTGLRRSEQGPTKKMDLGANLALIVLQSDYLATMKDILTNG